MTTQNAVSAWVGAIELRSGPSENRSIGSSIAMLKVLLPNTLPTARSKAPIRTAAMVATSSGSEVLAATRTVPTKVSPSPECSAISPAADATKGAATRMTSAETANRAIAAARPTRPPPTSVAPSPATVPLPSPLLSAATAPRTRWSRYTNRTPSRYAMAIAMLPIPTPPRLGAAPGLTRIIMPTNAVSITARRPDSACARETSVSIAPRRACMRSAIARMSRLKRLDPRRSPTATSSSPLRTALMSTASSGSEVAPASRTDPTRSLPRPASAATRSAARARNPPATITNAAATAN